MAHETVDVIAVDAEIHYLRLVEFPYAVDSEVVEAVLVPLDEASLQVKSVYELADLPLPKGFETADFELSLNRPREMDTRLGVWWENLLERAPYEDHFPTTSQATE